MSDITHYSAPELPRAAQLAGYLGLLPQVIAAAMALSSEEYRWTGLAAAYGYAAFIFSFIGGMWWGLGVGTRKAGAPAGPIFVAAVAPSLIAFLSYMPWIWGLDWPGPSMLLLGLCLMLSPMIDRWLQSQCHLPARWMQMRWTLSLGLGGLTFVLGILALL